MSERQRPIKALLREPNPPEVDALWERICVQREQRSPVRARRLILVPVFASVLALLGVKLFAPQPKAAPQSLSLADGSGLVVLETHELAKAVRLSDGSLIELAADSQLTPRALLPQLFATELDRGKATFDVVPHGPRRWLVSAANVQVEVLGTRFTVERSTAGVRVSVERGVVQVTGPNVPRGSVRLSADQKLYVPPARDPEAPPQPPAAAQPVANAPSQAAVPAQPSAEADAGTSTRPRVQRDSGTLAQLLARADQERVAGHHAQAAQLLERALEQHRSDPRAALAAFTLGNIYLQSLADPARAVEAFERAQTLGLPQALAEEGAARIVEACVRAGQLDRAREAAAAYRERYLNGRKRSKVEAWIKTP